MWGTFEATVYKAVCCTTEDNKLVCDFGNSMPAFGHRMEVHLVYLKYQLLS